MVDVPLQGPERHINNRRITTWPPTLLAHTVPPHIQKIARSQTRASGATLTSELPDHPASTGCCRRAGWRTYAKSCRTTMGPQRRVRTHAHARTRTHTHAHARTHTHAHTHTRTHTHTHNATITCPVRTMQQAKDHIAHAHARIHTHTHNATITCSVRTVQQAKDPCSVFSQLSGCRNHWTLRAHQGRRRRRQQHKTHFRADSFPSVDGMLPESWLLYKYKNLHDPSHSTIAHDVARTNGQTPTTPTSSQSLQHMHESTVRIAIAETIAASRRRNAACPTARALRREITQARPQQTQ